MSEDDSEEMAPEEMTTDEGDEGVDEAAADADGAEQAEPEAGPETAAGDAESTAGDDDETAREGLDADRIRGIVEAVLMTSDSPVTPGKLQALMKGVNGRDLRQAVDALNEAYRQGGHAMVITEVAGGFQIVTRREFGPWVRKFHDRSSVRLSQAALETLAIIAFKQPVTRIEVDNVRGVDSGGVLRTLMELNMIRIVGRSEGVGRPMLFGTTRDFMTHFGLRSLADLPRRRELEELLAEGERKSRAAGEAAPEDGLPAEGDAVIEADAEAADGDPDGDAGGSGDDAGGGDPHPDLEAAPDDHPDPAADEDAAPSHDPDEAGDVDRDEDPVSDPDEDPDLDADAEADDDDDGPYDDGPDDDQPDDDDDRR